MKKPNLGVLFKPASSDCNMACTYCYYRYVDDIYPDAERRRLSLDVFETALEQYLAVNPTEIKIGWQGGEPTLMGLDFFKQVVEVETKYAKPGDCFGNSLQTNGVLLDDEWCGWLAANRFLVGISVDGPEELNACRRFHDGRPAWRTTMDAIERLKRYEVEYNVLTVISQANCRHAREIFRFFVENDWHFSQFIPCTEPTGRIRTLSEQSVSAEEYADFMIELFEAWVENDDASYYIRRVDNWLHLFFGLPPECCEYRQDCSNLITVEWNGDVYPCDFHVKPENLLGNVREQTIEQMLNGRTWRRFVREAETLPEVCKDCEWLKICWGGCYRHRTKLGLELNEQPYLCEAKKRIFGHVFPRLEELVHGGDRPVLHEFLNRIGRDVAVGRFGPPPEQGSRPAARQQPPGPAPAARAVGKVDRNAPCPCGSGKKYKHCCGRKTGAHRSR